jgi:hypothetical protein
LYHLVFFFCNHQYIRELLQFITHGHGQLCMLISLETWFWYCRFWRRVLEGKRRLLSLVLIQLEELEVQVHVSHWHAPGGWPPNLPQRSVLL